MTDPDEPSPARPPRPDLAEVLLAALAGDTDPLDQLEAYDRAAAEDMQRWLALLAEHGPSEDDRATIAAQTDPALPALADDPIAMALGLVPDPERPLSAAALKRARQARGVRPSDVRAALTARGWQVAVADVARWERTDTAQPPALLTALAETLGVDPETLAPARELLEPRWLAGVLIDHRIAAALQQWAAESQQPEHRVRQALTRTLVGAGYRQQRAPSVEALLAVIAVLRELDDPERSR